MSVIRYSFNHQLSLLCNLQCYRAFGYKQNISNFSSQVDPTYFKSDIARKLYDHYRQYQFKYAEQGITPKAIAHQIQLHIKKRGDLQWTIDQFGNFIFTPTPQYLNKIEQKLLQQRKYQHQMILQFEQQAQKLKKETHYFDFYVHELLSVQQLRRILRMELKARVLENLNNHKVVRTIFRQNTSMNCNKNIQNISQMLFHNKQNKVEEQIKLYEFKRRENKQQTYFQYFGCSGENTIHFSKKLPQHMLINQYISSEQTPIAKLAPNTIRELINKKSILADNLVKKSNKLLEFVGNKEQLILLYGNLIDEHKFQAIQYLLSRIKTQEEQFRIIKEFHNKLISINF